MRKLGLCSMVLCCAAAIGGCDGTRATRDAGGHDAGGGEVDGGGPGPDAGPTCGDGAVEGAEACDDGNTGAGDGCDASCAVESGWTCEGAPSTCDAICGDGAVVGDEAGTTGCDDGNTTAGDGCDDACAVETGWACGGEPSACTPDCGDGVIAGMEECDDGDTDDGDGCSSACDAEDGWSCDGAEPTVCTSTCGDGVQVGAEGCDDGNTTDGDGCAAACTPETGYACAGTTPSVCATVCGDGDIVGAEGCDDGNTADGDGCSMACGFEAGWTCTGEPSACVTTCGDSITAGVEACDDGNTVTEACAYGMTSCAVCAADCTSAPGATSYCGDSAVDSANGEQCDDGNTTSGDGCSASCTLEAYCGDGVVNGTEACDDGNTVDGDCCSAACDTITCDEVESNGTSATASPITSGTPVTGSIDPAGDVDFWTFTLAVPSHVRIETFDATGTACAGIDTYVSLIATDGTTVLGNDDDDGLDLCSLVDPAADAFAYDLAAGTYYVVVRAYSATAVIPRYTLDVRVTAVGCGDAFLVAPEQCDDGNTAAGDGCSATCTIESTCGNSIVELLETCDDGGTTSGDGCSGTCRVQPAYSCTGAPSVCTLLSPDETATGAGTPIAIPEDDATGIASTATVASTCSVGWVRPTFTLTHTFAGDLVIALVAPDGTRVVMSNQVGGGRDLAGPYTFSTGAAPPWPPGGTATPIPAGAYAVNLTAFVGMPANGTWTLEVSDNAAVDTGTLASWSLEVGCLREIEPNDDGAPATGGAGIAGNDFSSFRPVQVFSRDAVIAGSISPAGDEDVFAITNSGATDVTVRIETGAPAIGACPSADTGINVRRADGSVVVSDDDDATGNCSLINATELTLPAGVTYYVHVVDYADNATIAAYQLSIDFM